MRECGWKAKEKVVRLGKKEGEAEKPKGDPDGLSSHQEPDRLHCLKLLEIGSGSSEAGRIALGVRSTDERGRMRKEKE